MKKLLAIILSALMLILPITASASVFSGNKTECVLTLNDGSSYGFYFGEAPTGEFVLHVDAGGVEVDAQFGAQTAYFRVLGMLLSMDYSDMMELSKTVSDAGNAAAANIDMDAIDLEAVTELMEKLGQDLAQYLKIDGDDSGINIDFNLTLKELYNACGADITAWIEDNIEMITKIAASTGEMISGDDILDGIKQVEEVVNAVDAGLGFMLKASMGEVLPNIDMAAYISQQSAEVVKLEARCGDAVGFEFGASVMGQRAFRFAAVPDGSGAYDIMINDAKLGNIRVSAGEGTVEKFTDGKGATPVMDFLKMVMQMNGAQ